MRKSIDGLLAVVQQQFKLDPVQPALFLFYERHCDRSKVLLWEGLSADFCYILNFFLISIGGLFARDRRYLVDFNLYDDRLSSEGKKSCNVRSRRFL